MDNGYAFCPKEWILDREIKSELPLLLLISNLCAKLGYCYASNKYFAMMFNTDEPSISKKIKKLSSKGYVLIEYKKRGTEITERKLRLSKMTTDHCQNSQPTVVKNDNGEGVSNVELTRATSKGNNTSINNKEIYKESFEMWWKEYPRHISKTDAFKKFTTILGEKKASFDELIKGAKDYAMYCEENKKEKQYIKHPSTWLNQGCWMDEYETELEDKYNPWG